MKSFARSYIYAVMLLGLGLDGEALAGPFSSTPRVEIACAVFVAAAMIAQARAVRAGSHASLHLTPAFLFAGVLILPAVLLVPLAVAPPLVEWAWDRLPGAERGARVRRPWWIHAFNSAMYTLMARGAQATVALIGGAGATPSFATPRAALAVVVAAAVFIALNYAIGGLGLVLSKRISWRATGLLDPDNLATECSVV